MSKVLVGVDGSPAAQSALEWSAQLASRGGFELIAARVFVYGRELSSQGIRAFCNVKTVWVGGGDEDVSAGTARSE